MNHHGNPHGPVMDAESWPVKTTEAAPNTSRAWRSPLRRVSITVDVPPGVDMVDVVIKLSQSTPPANDDGGRR